MEWWRTFTLNGEEMSECSFLSEELTSHDTGGDLLRHICTKAEFSNCGEVDWDQIIQSSSAYNRHRNDSHVYLLNTWPDLEAAAKNEEERHVLHATR